MEIRLNRAGLPDRDLLFRLLQYSLYEESAFDGNKMGEDGLFAYPWFDDYFADPAREAYLIHARNSETLLGFAMVHPYSPAVPPRYSVAEFLILPPFRRQGAGMAAARACFQAHSGIWEVSPSFGSEKALLEAGHRHNYGSSSKASGGNLSIFRRFPIDKCRGYGIITTVQIRFKQPNAVKKPALRNGSSARGGR